ncbi:MAG: hypothetical protein K5841_07660, partial [Fretibacterium sp.]|nr:hypothetical protein [Fretibacterium sp.]
MSGVDFLIGSEKVINVPLPACSDEALAFVSGLSAHLMKLQEARIYPDIAALAFWGRRAGLERMKQNCPESAQRLGRGLCFHVAPGNIPVNFAFTFLFGVLAGCANIVRLPARDFPQTSVLLKAIKDVLTDFPEIARRTAFVRYPANNDITAEFSRIADARMIWGGDRTIASIRSLPTPPRCVDLCFADRYSLCILDGNAVLEAGDEKIKRLAEGFYNDTYLMDQNACSSPQLILWLNDSKAARNCFWEAVRITAEKKYPLQAAVCVDKYVHACRDAIEQTGAHLTRQTNLLYRVELAALDDSVEQCRGRGGYFYEYSLDNSGELCAVVTDKYQTVTY